MGTGRERERVHVAQATALASLRRSIRQKPARRRLCSTPRRILLRPWRVGWKSAGGEVSLRGLERSGSLDPTRVCQYRRNSWRKVAHQLGRQQEIICFRILARGMNATWPSAENPAAPPIHNPGCIGLNLLREPTRRREPNRPAPRQCGDHAVTDAVPRRRAQMALVPGGRKGAGNSRRMTPANARASRLRTGVDAAAGPAFSLALAGCRGAHPPGTLSTHHPFTT